MPACLLGSAYSPACLSACLPTCVPACPPACLPAYLPTCLPTCIPVCLPAWLTAWLTARLHTRSTHHCVARSEAYWQALRRVSQLNAVGGVVQRGSVVLDELGDRRVVEGGGGEKVGVHTKGSDGGGVRGAPTRQLRHPVGGRTQEQSRQRKQGGARRSSCIAHISWRNKCSGCWIPTLTGKMKAGAYTAGHSTEVDVLRP